MRRPNLINQRFQTKGKNEIWLEDFTYIPTKAGTLYLSVFIDVYMGNRMQGQLVTDALNQAYHREKPKEGLIVHTDQGSQ
ncbi:DDE-type integrase/transposase/recombinase [Streptococcus mutans]|uniref:DDE-type integrase/transposase/recombinase n=1 Tax=Streptococcus mutans TaxID=1309 RepID=UPI00138AF4C7|nr:DDE-type integrase/transposase/recombinase [Streptococcus mutans]